MESLSTDVLKLFNIPNVPDSRRLVELSKIREGTELLGFQGDNMVFRMNTMDNLLKTSEEKKPKGSEGNTNLTNTEANAIPIPTQTIFREEFQKKCEVLSNTVSMSDKQIHKIVLEPNGKKFLFLNGKKLQIIKHSPKLLHSETDNNISGTRPFPKVVPNVRNGSGTRLLPSLVPNVKNGSKRFSIQPKQQLPVKLIEHSRKINILRKQPMSISPRFSGKIVSINTNSCPTQLSNLMKQVGGTIRLINSATSSNQGIPLTKDSSSSTPVHTKPIKVIDLKAQGPLEMETSQCSCKKKWSVVGVSTNTEPVKSEDKAVQTEQVLQKDQVYDESERKNLIGEHSSSSVIIGDDVNMGHGPPGIFAINERNMKIKFLHDLQECLKWDCGSLPIHKGVIDQDLQLVKHQCMILKIRKVGVNIPESNNYTPLQLAVINNVKIQIVEVLLEYNADMSVLDSEGNNLLHLAVEQNRNDLIKIFLERKEGSRINIDHFNYEGLTPLMMCALLSDRIDMTEQLLKHQAQLNLKDRKSGRSAIFHAAVSHNVPMVLLLLDAGADTKIRNFFGTSVHDAMFELDDIPNEIKYPILGRDLKMNEKRKLSQQDSRKQDASKQEKRQDTFKRKKLEIVSTIQKLESKANFIVSSDDTFYGSPSTFHENPGYPAHIIHPSWHWFLPGSSYCYRKISLLLRT